MHVRLTGVPTVDETADRPSRHATRDPHTAPHNGQRTRHTNSQSPTLTNTLTSPTHHYCRMSRARAQSAGPLRSRGGGDDHAGGLLASTIARDARIEATQASRKTKKEAEYEIVGLQTRQSSAR